MATTIELGEKGNKVVKLVVIIFIIISILPFIIAALIFGGIALFSYFMFGHYDIVTTGIGYYSPSAIEMQEYSGRMLTYDEYVDICKRYNERPMFSSKDSNYVCAVIDSAHKPRITNISWGEETLDMTILLKKKNVDEEQAVCQFMIYKPPFNTNPEAKVTVRYDNGV